MDGWTMTILIKANLKCNFVCSYCYEHPIRPEEEVIDLAAIEATVERLYKKKKDQEDKRAKAAKRDPNPKYYGTITLHGGEPTILPKPIFERLLKYSHQLSGRSGIQTNGHLIDDDHLEMFKKYNTSIGFSIDGPWPLNRLRGLGTKKARKRQTEKILNTIYRTRETLKEKDRFLSVSVIVVIHQANAMGDNREVLKQWIKTLPQKGIRGRLNICCSGNPEIDLTPEQAVDFYTDMYDFFLANGIRGFSPFKDIYNSLTGKDDVVCVFKECDPFSAPASVPIFHDGSVGSCLRLYVDGKKYLRCEPTTDIRGQILSQTDCKGCLYWENCRGGCSGLAIDNDWRRKDRYCLYYKAIFERTLNTMKALGIKRVTRKRKGDTKTRRENHTDGIVHCDDGWVHEDGFR